MIGIHMLSADLFSRYYVLRSPYNHENLRLSLPLKSQDSRAFLGVVPYHASARSRLGLAACATIGRGYPFFSATAPATAPGPPPTVGLARGSHCMIALDNPVTRAAIYECILHPGRFRIAHFVATDRRCGNTVGDPPSYWKPNPHAPWLKLERKIAANNQMIHEISLASTPVDHQVLGQERRGHHAGAIVHPSTMLQLSHGSVHNGEPVLAVAPGLAVIVIVLPPTRCWWLRP